MRKLLKWIGIVLGGLVGLMVIAAAALYLRATLTLTRHYDIQPAAIVIPTDAASVQRGQHLVEMTCTDCHGADLSGKTFFSDPSIGVINTANLTPGRGGPGTAFTDADWVRAIRHGVDNHGRGLVAMPSDAFYHFSDADLASMVAYLKTLPPVDKQLPPTAFTPVATVLIGAGAFGRIISAEAIPHTAPRPAAPPVAVNAEYGGYLVEVLHCSGCHGAKLSGGKPPEPGSPLAPNLTPGGELGFWKEADFVKALRTGVTPSGRTLTRFMPWQTYSHMNDDELGALWLYLTSLPKQASTTQ